MTKILDFLTFCAALVACVLMFDRNETAFFFAITIAIQSLRLIYVDE